MEKLMQENDKLRNEVDRVKLLLEKTKESKNKLQVSLYSICFYTETYESARILFHHRYSATYQLWKVSISYFKWSKGDRDTPQWKPTICWPQCPKVVGHLAVRYKINKFEKFTINRGLVGDSSKMEQVCLLIYILV